MATTNHHADECPTERYRYGCWHQIKTCWGCGKAMHAARSDAKTASAACRQRLHRHGRVTLPAEISEPSVTTD